MKKLFDIIGDSKILNHVGDLSVPINEIKIDSRKVVTSDLYIAIRGFTSDGHSYIEKAITAGAKAVICEELPEARLPNITYVVVENTREAAGEVARSFYNDPSADVKLVGVTGTNGKTTVATLLFQLFTGLGFKVGLISTVENKVGEDIIPATHTTPDVVSLNALLRQMVDAGCEYVFMEVSSHAVDQRRIAGIEFTGGVFTNMSHDHLDYHETFENYIAAKKRFFDDLPVGAFAITNLDDKRGEVMLQNTKANKVTYGLHHMAKYKGKIISNTIDGLALSINEVEAHFRMVGSFNAYNLLAVYGVASELGFSADEVLTVLTNIAGAEGRFEKIVVNGSKKVGIVDYAHTPDALLNVLETIQQVKHTSANILTVVGCGGDRDKTKRPKMANVAAKLSSRVILTSDNPRTENPEEILDEMEAGVEQSEKGKTLRISDRKQAIKTAVMLAADGDIILIAGKGHEKYQEINGIKNPFDDKQVLRAALLESS